jgi:hypothetical protein
VRSKSGLFIIILLTLSLSACSLGKTPEPTIVPTSSPIPAPSSVPTPSAPLAVLLMPADMDKTTSDAYQTAVYNLTQGSGMRFQVRNSLTPQEIDPGLSVVVALPPDPGISALASAEPHVQFLAIDIPGVTAGGNVSVLGTGSSAAIPAFVAGYAGAMISDDHHIGMLFPKDDATAQAAAGAFANGMAYYCGTCQPFYYVPYGFPQFQAIPSDAPKNQYSGYANVLVSQYKVDTFYLYPGVAIPELTDALTSAGINMIGVAAPNPKPGTWILTIQPDEVKAIDKAWPDLTAGKGGQNVQSPLGLADVDPNVISPGKERLIQQVLDDLLAGRIATGVGQ